MKVGTLRLPGTVGLVLVAVAMVTGRARADQDQACGPLTRAWAAACTAAGAGRVEAFRCPVGHVVFTVTVDDHAPVFVDAAREPSALRQIQGVGLSPIGEFVDFGTAPQPVRDGLERVAACVAHHPEVPLDEPPRFVATADRRNAWPPWRLVAGVVLAGIVVARGARRFRLRELALLLALGAATFCLAELLVGPSFFHQNGHGPNWVGYALGEPCTYGPGYEELFGWAARLRTERPEALLFGLNGALAATCPVAAWVVSRRAGSRRWLAWLIAAAVAVDPLLLRIAFTESYYVSYMALLFAGTAVALSAPTLRAWSPRFLLANVAAGLILGQAARVHPVGWIAVAAVPLANLARPGAPRRSLRHAAAATAVVGLVVLATAGPAVLEVLRGATGAQYLPELRHGSHQELREWLYISMAAAIAMGVARAWRGRWPIQAALVVVVLVGESAGTSLLNVDVDWVRAAHARLFLAPAMAAMVGLVSPCVRRWRIQRAAAALLITFGLANAVSHRRWVTELPTDALELRLALAWREKIQPQSRLVAVETAGIPAVQLPIYAAHQGEHAPLILLDAHGMAPALTSFGDSTYYYRSSVCSTALGHAWCGALERTAVLEPVDVHDLPARPSTRACVYDSPMVRVGLYRVSRAVAPP